MYKVTHAWLFWGGMAWPFKDETQSALQKESVRTAL
jgi:hypothetical protein